MHIEQLEVSSFRNLASQTISFPSPVTLLLGLNGQGKTSLLEAIHLLSQAKSFRTAKPRDIVTWGQSESFIKASVQTKDGTREICFQIGNGRRRAFVNGNPVKKASLFFGQLASVSFTPDDLQLIKGGPSYRREFLDQILAMIFPEFVENSVRYQKALKNRNVILKSIRNGSFSQSSFDRLSPWEVVLAETGSEVYSYRSLLSDLLEPKAKKYYKLFLDKKTSSEEAIALMYESDFSEDGKKMEKTKILSLFEERREQDIQRKATSFGVHRDELSLLLDTRELNAEGGVEEKLARRTASQGQARSFALALKLAATEYLTEQTGETPVLLLDDVKSELDFGRRNRLFQLLGELGCQVILTATDVSGELLQELSQPLLLDISKGQITPPKELHISKINN